MVRCIFRMQLITSRLLNRTTRERGAISATFIVPKSSNSVLQLERAVQSLYSVGTSICTSRITRRGAGAGGVCADRGNGLPLTRRTCSTTATKSNRDGLSQPHKTNKDSHNQMKAKMQYDNKITRTNNNLWAFEFLSERERDGALFESKNKTVMEMLIYHRGGGRYCV